MTLESKLLQLMNAASISNKHTLQALWNGYGSIDRYYFKLNSGKQTSVVVKVIQTSNQSHHPRGWNSNRSHLRKVQSYQVEQYWYQHWAQLCNQACPVPASLATFHIPAINAQSPNTQAIVLSDLDALGFSYRAETLSAERSKACLTWLANFHAQFMVDSVTRPSQAHNWPKGLWPIGSYWHLATRPDEFKAMTNSELKTHAHAISEHLNNCRFKTLIHGDAKVANFCFNQDGTKVAAVDFQYVGAGCGMKDIAYFLGSCLSEADCAEHYPELLDHYFSELNIALNTKDSCLDLIALETQWRALFTVAWADFHRFILGWSPDHFKNNCFSDFMSKQAIKSLKL